MLILENWLKLEEKYGSEESVSEVKSKMPKRVKKWRKIKLVESTETGEQEVTEEGGWEEFYDFVFPEEQKSQKLKILEIA